MLFTNRGSNGADPVRDALSQCRATIGWALIFGAGVNILYLAPSLYMMQVYDRVLASGSLTTLVFVSLALAAALAALVALDGLRGALMARVGRRLDELLSDRLIKTVVMSRQVRPRQAVRDLDVLRQTIAGPAAAALMDVPWSPFYMAICFLLHPMLGVLVAVGGILLVAVAVANERAQRGALAQAEERAPRTYAGIDNDQMSAEAIRAMGMERVVVQRRLDERGAALDAQDGATFSGLRYTALTKFLRLGLQSAALGLGAYLALAQLISPGAIIAASILTARALAPLEQIVGAWRQFGAARAAHKSVVECLAESSSDSGRTRLPAPRGLLVLEHVTVRLPEADHFALRDIGFTIAPGEMVGVIGASGAGKSTLARAAAGALEPDIGSVRLDGASYSDWPRDQLGAHIGYVPQDIGLLGGSIADNIRRFSPEPESDDRVIAAAKAAGVHETILRLPAAYETSLAPGGRGLSAGQAQRIAIARALYNDPALIVLDEANAHLDSEGEAHLIAALAAARARGAAMLVVAHRTGLLARADKLLVLNDGRIEMFGPREEVLRKLNATRVQPAPLHAAGA